MGAGVFDEGVVFGDDLLERRVGVLAEGREGKTLGRTNEQACTDFVFDRFDVLAQHGLGNVGSLCCSSEAARFGNGYEFPDMLDAHDM